MHLALIAVVIAFAWLLLQSFQTLEHAIRGDDQANYFTQYIPLFSVVLISGFVTQLILQLFNGDRFFDRQLFNTISSFGLDMVIVGALATLSLSVVKEYWVAIVVLTLGGLLWNLSVFFLFGPRLFPKPWHPYALGDLGGGTATTASGLLLIRVADPEQHTHARQSYSEKQPFYEPFMGGGLVTAMALPLVAMLGAWPCLLITAAILAAWIAYGLIRVRMEAKDR
jgi:ESS family glutamate:Na+ symporter